MLLKRTRDGLAVALALTGMAATAGPAQAKLMPAAVYREPPAPHCGAMAARYGPQRLWFGAISGARIDQFWDRQYPHYAEGCFLSERDCQRWLHENLTFMNGGGLNWMRCRPGLH